MSNFTRANIQIKDQRGLVKALQSMGYKPVVHQTKEKVRGHGYESLQAEIILKKEDLADGGDIGFNKLADGTFEVVTDIYVMRKISPKELVKKLTLAYGKVQAADTLRNLGFKESHSSEANGQTRIVYVQA